MLECLASVLHTDLYKQVSKCKAFTMHVCSCLLVSSLQMYSTVFTVGPLLTFYMLAELAAAPLLQPPEIQCSNDVMSTTVCSPNTTNLGLDCRKTFPGVVKVESAAMQAISMITCSH